MASMAQYSAVSDQGMFYFERKGEPTLLVTSLAGSQLEITRVNSKAKLLEVSSMVTHDKKYPIHTSALDRTNDGWGIWVDGEFRHVDSDKSGRVGIYDLGSHSIAETNETSDCVRYHLPRATLDAFTDSSGLPRVEGLLCVRDARDQVLHHLTLMILPSLEQPSRFCQPFLDHFLQALCAHIVNTYSTIKAASSLHKGGLANWQKRRVKELLTQHSATNLKLSSLAKECGLSVSHFARSFKKSFGTSVHRYLLIQRVETAKALLLHPSRTLPDIALEVGFSDQAAFSRTFGVLVGTTPGKWRREQSVR
jgi:AraC family transcriptional regulator